MAMLHTGRSTSLVELPELKDCDQKRGAIHNDVELDIAAQSVTTATDNLQASSCSIATVDLDSDLIDVLRGTFSKERKDPWQASEGSLASTSRLLELIIKEGKDLNSDEMGMYLTYAEHLAQGAKTYLEAAIAAKEREVTKEQEKDNADI